MQKAAEEDPEVKGIKKSPHEPFLISHCEVESIAHDFFYGPEFVRYIIRLQAELTLLSVRLSEPLDEARFMDIFEGAFALANLFQKNLILHVRDLRLLFFIFCVN